MTTLTNAQLSTIADSIFITGDRTKTRPPKPVTGGSAAFKAALDPIASDANFKDAGIGVIDFTNDPMHPDVWLHNGDEPFRIGSASKIAMMLAAVQLRLDVRKILDLSPKIISTPAEFDAAFSNPALWAKAKAPKREMRAIAAHAPLISKIFDFTKPTVDFAGPDPDQQTILANQQAIFNKLPASSHELEWETAPPLTFSERYWLTGALSDNVAATTCVSEIGVPYLKAVQRAYGLADHPSGGMHLLASGGYANIPGKTTPPAPPPPRQLSDVEPIGVNDFWLSSPGHYDDKRSWVPGSAAALTAYMIALMTDAFADPGTGLVAGQAACQTIRNNTAGKGLAIRSFLVSGLNGTGGVASVANINELHDKIGILKRSDGAKNPLLCEFVFIETEEIVAPTPPKRNKMRYGVVVCGLMSLATGPIAAEKSELLGIAVHRALLTL